MCLCIRLTRDRNNSRRASEETGRSPEVRLARGETVAQVCKVLGVTDQTFYRWRREYGGLRIDQAKRL
ncbi:MAG: transposase, partial [Chloroflexi bacterium]|nr:transposase [Chloroflexota bacterium]